MLSMIRGDDQVFNITFTDTASLPYDITDCVVFFTVKKEEDLDDVDDAKAILSKTVSVHDSNSGGTTHFNIASTESSAITASVYYYDIQLKDATGNIKSTARDKFEITKDVTRRIT